jgi:hypothetical protein
MEMKTVIAAMLLLTSGPALAQDERATEILPADYAKCQHNFSECKGKFIKFEGVIIDIGGGSGEGAVNRKLVRIATPMHGFDVQLTEEPEPTLYGAKVLFSGYLTHGHVYYDDVSRGRIDAVLMTATEVDAEKQRLCERGKSIQHSSLGNGAGVKKDILGFFPGMSKEEFLGRTQNGCDGLSAEFTEKLDQNLVKKIAFKFMSGTPPTEMVASVSEQFRAKPTKPNWSAEIKHATQGHECPFKETTSIHDLSACVGGLIAKWRLEDNLILDLTLNSPAAGTRPNAYILTLSSEAIARLEAQAEQDRIKEQDMRVRKINPRQRF